MDDDVIYFLARARIHANITHDMNIFLLLFTRVSSRAPLRARLMVPFDARVSVGMSFLFKGRRKEKKEMREEQNVSPCLPLHPSRSPAQLDNQPTDRPTGRSLYSLNATRFLQVSRVAERKRASERRGCRESPATLSCRFYRNVATYVRYHMYYRVPS